MMTTVDTTTATAGAAAVLAAPAKLEMWMKEPHNDEGDLLIVLYKQCIEFLQQGPLLDTKAFLAWWARNYSAGLNQVRDADDNTLLHTSLWCNCPASVVEYLIASCPESAKEKDKEGDTPLHFAIVFQAPPSVVQAVFNAWPDAAKEANHDGDTPLLMALVYEAPFSVVHGILTACPDAAKIKDADGNTPLHRALAKRAPDPIIHAILAAWMDGARESNKYGSSPIHVAMSYHASEDVIQALISAASTSTDYQHAFTVLCRNLASSRTDSLPKPTKANSASDSAKAGTRKDTSSLASLWANGMEERTGEEMAAAAADAYPMWIKEHPACAKEQDLSGYTLLHHALAFGTPAPLVRATLDAWPGAAKARCKKMGNTVLHIAFLGDHPDRVVLDILGAFPEAALAKNWKGKSPVDCALQTLRTQSTWNTLMATVAATSKDSGFELLCKVLQQKVSSAATVVPALRSILALWPDAANGRTPAKMDWKRTVTQGGDTLLHVALQNDAPGPVLRAIIEASPQSLEIRGLGGNGLTPLNAASPEALVSLFEGLHMQQFSTAAATESNAITSIGHLQRSTLDTLAFLHRILPAALVRSAFDACPNAIFDGNLLPPEAEVEAEVGGGGDADQTADNRTHRLDPVKQKQIGAVAAACTARFRTMAADFKADHPFAKDSTAPPSETLACLNVILDGCFQSELTVASSKCHLSTDYTPHMQMYINPLIELIRAELAAFKDNVAKNPAPFREMLNALALADSAIYDRAFLETLNVQTGGDSVGFELMLRSCADISRHCPSAGNLCQKTSHLIPLVLMVREAAPDFKAAVAAAVTQASMGESDCKIIYMPKTKSPFRIIEKSFTKGPNAEYPDCKLVFDVFGCLIDCKDYKSIRAIIHVFVERQKRGLLQIVRVKNRWTAPTIGGWRDLIVNLLINGVVFEVQIVLRAMLNVRTRSFACKAYREFRSVLEAFELLGLSTELSRQDFPFAVAAAAVPRVSQQRSVERAATEAGGGKGPVTTGAVLNFADPETITGMADERQARVCGTDSMVTVEQRVPSFSKLPPLPLLLPEDTVIMNDGPSGTEDDLDKTFFANESDAELIGVAQNELEKQDSFKSVELNKAEEIDPERSYEKLAEIVDRVDLPGMDPTEAAELRAALAMSMSDELSEPAPSGDTPGSSSGGGGGVPSASGVAPKMEDVLELECGATFSLVVDAKQQDNQDNREVLSMHDDKSAVLNSAEMEAEDAATFDLEVLLYNEPEPGAFRNETYSENDDDDDDDNDSNEKEEVYLATDDETEDETEDSLCMSEEIPPLSAALVPQERLGHLGGIQERQDEGGDEAGDDTEVRGGRGWVTPAVVLGAASVSCASPSDPPVRPSGGDLSRLEEVKVLPKVSPQSQRFPASFREKELQDELQRKDEELLSLKASLAASQFLLSDLETTVMMLSKQAGLR